MTTANPFHSFAVPRVRFVSRAGIALICVFCTAPGTRVLAQPPSIELLEPAPAPPELLQPTPEPEKTAPDDPKLPTPEQRFELVKKHGGTAETEAAVAAGLEWLKSQQLPDGSWAFDKAKGGKAGSLKDCGTGGTGMALLCYLGAGQTHLSGDYRQPVFNGLLYLVKQTDAANNAADLRSGSPTHAGMYAHCIATRALCEAYLLTKGQLDEGLPGSDDGKGKTPRERSDERRKLALLRLFQKKLKTAAQLAVNFIVVSQDKTGGWRYEPRTGADTSVSSWAITALHAGYAAGLQIPTAAIRGANLYLTRVQVDGGAQYGYTDATPNRPGTSAAGLLSRMYLNQKHAGIPKGIAYLSSVGPTLNDMYFNHYATQAVFHRGGDDWESWNLKNRTMLVTAQRKTGASKGSWPAAGAHSAVGGDLLQTCFCLLTLEVYRQEPIYARADTESSGEAE